jgi:hypothetical protein
VRLDALHALDRFASVQAVVSSGCLVQGAKALAGKRVGTSGKPIGHVPLQWAFAEAATWCLRTKAAGHISLARCEKQPGKGQALTLLAHKLARAVSEMRKRPTAFALETCLHGEGSRAGEPDVELDPLGMRLDHADALSSLTASLHAKGRRGRVAPSPGRCLDPCAGS